MHSVVVSKILFNNMVILFIYPLSTSHLFVNPLSCLVSYAIFILFFLLICVVYFSSLGKLADWTIFYVMYVFNFLVFFFGGIVGKLLMCLVLASPVECDYGHQKSGIKCFIWF